MADILEVQRFSPECGEGPHFDSYEIPYRSDWVVLDALNYIKDQIDGSLTFRWSCRMGICGSCGMMVRKYLTAAQLVELTGAIALENFRSCFNRALKIESDGFCELPLDHPVRRAMLHAER